MLVGDERQLPSIAAGGVFEGLTDRLGAIELTEVHRQDQVWDRDALDELRHGDISQWVAAYERHGRLVTTSGPDEQTRALVEDWYVASRADGMDQTLMLATRRQEVEALNELARAARVAAGRARRHRRPPGQRPSIRGRRPRHGAAKHPRRAYRPGGQRAVAKRQPRHHHRNRPARPHPRRAP
ncbi:MAG: AAA family ATPase [Thermoleophilaceae bacterium]